MTGRLESKVIVVTGGSSGIGKAVVERAAAEGAAVVIGARGKDAGEQVAEDVRAGAGGRCSSPPTSPWKPTSPGWSEPASRSSAG